MTLPCPECTRALQHVAYGAFGDPEYYCPACGTYCDSDGDTIFTPELVAACRNLLNAKLGQPMLGLLNAISAIVQPRSIRLHQPPPEPNPTGATENAATDG